MTPRTQNLFTVLALLMAVVALGGLIFAMYQLQQERDARAATLMSAAQASALDASTARTHSFVASTEAARNTLTSFIGPDIVSVATLISKIGKTTGIKIQLSNALPQGVVAKQTSTTPAIYAVGFVVEAQGSFAALMRAEKLLENLPLPSTIRQLDIQSTPSPDGSASGQWHMSVSLQVLTTAPVSS